MDAAQYGQGGQSPVEKAPLSLEAIDPKWRIDIGIPDDSPLWIRCVDFLNANEDARRGL